MSTPAPGGVEDLVIRADLASRQALLEPSPPVDGALRGLAAVTATAAALSQRMPHPSEGADQELAIARLGVMTQSLMDWPHLESRRPAASGRPQLDQVADLLRQASGADPDRLDPADTQRVRARVLHTVYVTAHAADVALREEVWTQVGRGEPEQARSVQAVRDRISIIEHVAGAAVNGRPERTQAPDPAMSRLAAAFTDWDTRAHQALLDSPTTPTLEVIAHTQALMTRTSGILIGAAATAGHASHDVYHARLAPSLQDSAQHWSALRGHLSEFASIHARPPTDLVASSRKLRSAARDVVLDQGSVATPAAMARRVDLSHVAALARHSIGSGADLALISRDVATRSQTVTAPAALIARKLREWGEGLPPGPGRDPLSHGLSPRDLHQRRDVPLPSVLRGAITETADLLAQHALKAVSASAGVWPAPGHSPAPGIATRPTAGPPRNERTPPTMGRGKPGPSVGR